MNACERVLCALRREEPDRLPMLELEVEASVREKLAPKASLIEFYEQSDLDAIVVFEDVPFVDVAPGVKRDHFGVLRDFRKMDGLSWPFPLEPLVNEDVEDLMGFLDGYRLPNPHDPERLATLQLIVKRFKGEKAVVFGHHSSFIYQSFIRGFENLLTDYILNPDFARRLTDMVCDYFVELMKHAIEYGADAVIDCEDYCSNRGPFLSVDHFKEFLLPGLQKVINVAKKRKVPFLKHSDGYLWPLMDILVEAGIDALQAIEPAAGMDIGEVKRVYGNRIAVIGNIDCAQLLTFGSPGDVRKATIDCIRKASPCGGHILSSSNIIHQGVPPENYLAMTETVKEYGRYPIRL